MSPNAAQHQYRHTTDMLQLAPLAVIGLIISLLHIYPASSWPANACKLKTKNHKIPANGKFPLFVQVDSFSFTRCPVDLMFTLMAEHAEASTREEGCVVYMFFGIKNCDVSSFLFCKQMHLLDCTGTCAWFSPPHIKIHLCFPGGRESTLEREG